MPRKINLSDEINRLFNQWLTSLDSLISQKSFNLFYKKLKLLTERIIWSEYRELFIFLDDIYHDMIERILIAQSKDMIDNLDYFCSWYREALKNLLLNKVISENRYKRKYIIPESKLTFEYETAEDKYSFDFYQNEEQLSDLKEIIYQILNKDIEKKIFYERHVLDFSIKKLAQSNNSTEANIKYRLGKTKKRLQKRLNVYLHKKDY